jgi:hypothetical protein
MFSGGHVRIVGVIRRALAPLLAVVCLLVLAGCNNDSGSDKSSSKTVDGIPAYATTNDDQGAQNFGRYWIDTLNKATVSGDTSKVRSISKSSCETCTDFANRLDGIYKAGGSVKTDGFKVKKILNDSSVPKPGAGVSVVLTATPQTLVEKKGAAPRHIKGGDLRLRLIMVRVKDHWAMDRIDVG